MDFPHRRFCLAGGLDAGRAERLYLGLRQLVPVRAPVGPDQYGLPGDLHRDDLFLVSARRSRRQCLWPAAAHLRSVVTHFAIGLVMANKKVLRTFLSGATPRA